MTAQPRILVVDDEPANRDLLESILEAEGYAVEHAENGQGALDRIARGGIDLVLLDVMMPGIDGIDTCRRIREELARPMLPIVMVTALSDRKSRVSSKSGGADDFLVKPISQDELVARVRNLLSRSTYYEVAQRERARAEAEAARWKLVSDVASTVASCTDYGVLQVSIRELLRKQLPIDAFVFLEMNDGALYLPSADAFDGALGAARPRMISSAPWAEILGGRRVVPGEECAGELKAIAHALHRTRAQHGAVLPLMVGGDLHGLMALFASRALERDELLLIEELGPHLANAVTNVRSHLKVRELNEARDRLSLLLVHDLKNPLSVISMNLEMLTGTALTDEERAEMLADSRASADRMLSMLTDLLDIARAEEGRLVLKRAAISAHKLVEAVRKRYASIAERRGIAVRADIDPALIVEADAGLLARVLENLVGNGLRFVQNGGSIGVSAALDEDQLVLRVHNDGPPLDARARSRLFEKYGGAEMGRTTANRGLGLYFCRLVAEAHGGSIRAIEPDDGGVAFEIRLPSARLRRLLRRRGSSSRWDPPSAPV